MLEVTVRRDPGEMGVFFECEETLQYPGELCLILDCGLGGRLLIRDSGEPGMEVELRKTMRGYKILRKRDPYTVTMSPNVQGRWLDILTWAVEHYHDKRR